MLHGPFRRRLGGRLVGRWGFIEEKRGTKVLDFEVAEGWLQQTHLWLVF